MHLTTLSFQVRYEVWEELGSLPVYNAVRVRALSKTGDMKLSYGGTPSDLRYKANRGSNGTPVSADNCA